MLGLVSSLNNIGDVLVSTLCKRYLGHVEDDSRPLKKTIKKINAKNVIAYDFTPEGVEVEVAA